MAIQVYRTPQRRDDTVDVTVDGQILRINGTAYDLSEISEPTPLDNEFVVGSVFRLNGDVHVRIVQPYGYGDEVPENDVMPDEPQGPLPFPPITARQLRLGLVLNGFSLDQVSSTIEAIENEQDRAVATIEWEWASSFERDHPLLQQVGVALGLTEQQIDAMWQQASTL